MTRTQVLSVVLGLVLGANAMAQDAPAAGDQDVQAELKALKSEIKALRGELKQVLNEVRQIKTQERAQPKKTPPEADTTVYNIDVADAPSLGPKDAKVTIVEYVDLQCPYCAKEAPVIKQVLAAYPNDVRWVFKHFPLSFHKQAKPAHAAIALAFTQKGDEGFWKMHDLILAAPKKLGIADLRAHAEAVGMDLAAFDAVMADEKQIDALLQKDMVGAKKYNVRGTPTVFVNGLRLSPRGLDNYKTRVDAILSGKAQPKAAAKPNSAGLIRANKQGN